MICWGCRESIHGTCRGGTHCDCQHYPRGSMVNWGKINGSQESEAGFSTIHPDGRGDSGESPPVHSVDQETEGAQ